MPVLRLVDLEKRELEYRRARRPPSATRASLPPFDDHRPVPRHPGTQLPRPALPLTWISLADQLRLFGAAAEQVTAVRVVQLLAGRGPARRSAGSSRPTRSARCGPQLLPGSPAATTPATFRPGAFRCAMYQIDGIEYSRCMSLHRIGLPGSGGAPATAQAFEPGCTSPPARTGNRKLTFAGSPSRQQVALQTFVPPRRGQVAEHVQPDQQRSAGRHGAGWYPSTWNSNGRLLRCVSMK